MFDKIKELSLLLIQSNSESSLLDCLSVFFKENFNAELLNITSNNTNISSENCFPLQIKDENIGYIKFATTNKPLNEFLDISLPMISLKLQNIVLSEKMQNAIDFQNSMKNIAKLIESQYELKYIIPLMGEIIDKFIKSHLVYIFVNEKEKLKLMWPLACKDEHIFDVISAKPLKRVTNGELGIFPMIYENKLQGYIVTKNIDDKLSLKEIEYLDEIAKQSSTTINRAHVYGEILKHATLDALTGFYNRGQLEERLRQELSSSKRQKTPLCVIMSDIDFFKKVNDTYGHSIGDLVLKTVAKVMRSKLREYDIAARYGGEEFVLILPFTKLDEAKMVAERLRKSVEDKKIDISKLNRDVPEKEISVTISIGVHEFNGDSEEILQKADKALYNAKKTGRNRVVVYE